ncbi:selenocysteine-specific translation elongation factor [Jatrophihabitans telluris]|uniref:Selenocysteine-specific translation elongation factor n=1 Tax=Jatrophihabitans telluris TaxID=2038343 RepID=A0ABY4QT86_9ACTN|nr:selenocysteine-specific translation elongation factor [Jatrophihabitans telluris]UQX86929.1 selenocysteine-specific translation elongation factor [Jatrophihabitans telluris]
MHVVAAAGHVDHGKSTLIRALTGMEPDRWAEERRRGMTIDLGYAWLQLESGVQLAFVDVPGHQRFIANMLAGLGPAPAVLLVIAADEGWRRQTGEHLDAIRALGIEHGVLAVTRSDLADPRPVIDDAHARLRGTGLQGLDAVAVSGTTGQGLPELRQALGRMVAALPQPRVDGPMRLWVDRAFTIRGSGTIVTGTLGAGRIVEGQSLELNGGRVQVRGLQELGVRVASAQAVARVAVNLRGVDRDDVRRGDCLLSPGDWRWTDSVDVALDEIQGDLAGEIMVHIGAAATSARLRLLNPDSARLTLLHRLPLRVGDRAVLRDPGQQVVAAGAIVVDPDPPSLTRRGDASLRGAVVASRLAGTVADQVRRRGAIREADLLALGVVGDQENGVMRQGEWLVDPDRWADWIAALGAFVDDHAAGHPQQPGTPDEAARRAIALPDPALLAPLAAEIGLRSTGGRLSRPGVRSSMGRAEASLAALERRWRDNPLDAPDRNELAELGLGPREIAAATSIGRALRLATDVIVSPGAVDQATAELGKVSGPFTSSDARLLLGVSRRVAIPLLEHLDSLGVTTRIDANHRVLVRS